MMAGETITYATSRRNGPIRLAPVYSPVALRRRVSISKGCNRPLTVLVRAFQQLWLLEANEVYQQFTYVVLAEFAWPLYRAAAGSIDPFPVARVNRL
jgi:hypothetical protein